MKLHKRLLVNKQVAEELSYIGAYYLVYHIQLRKTFWNDLPYHYNIIISVMITLIIKLIQTFVFGIGPDIHNTLLIIPLWNF